jgi:hypothetical protein
MHTKEVKVPGFDDVRVHYNSDWSGDAIIVWQRGADRSEVEVPGDVLVALAGGEEGR